MYPCRDNCVLIVHKRNNFLINSLEYVCLDFARFWSLIVQIFEERECFSIVLNRGSKRNARSFPLTKCFVDRLVC